MGYMEKVEQYFELASDLRFLGMMLAAAYCYYYLLKKFMIREKGVWLAGLAYFFPIAILYYLPFRRMGSFAAYLLGSTAGLLAAYLLERKHMKQKLFLAVTFFSLRWMTFAMMDSIDTAFYRLVDSVTERNARAGSGWQARLAVCALVNLADVILYLAILFFSVWLIQKVYLYKEEGLTLKEMSMLLISPLSAMIGYEVLQYYGAAYERDTGRSVYEMYGVYSGLCFLQYVFFFFAILVVIAIFQDLKRGQREETQNHILLGQIEDMKSHIRRVEELYKDIRGLKHDMGNHMTVLESLYRENEAGEAKRYMERLREELGSVDLEVKSGNPITDIILTEKKKEAEEKGIIFRCIFHYPDKTGINAFDLSVILNNAITNAIENIGEDGRPFIHILSYRKKNAFMIELENSFQGCLKYGADSDLPETSKKNGREHGFGLINIRRMAQKYHGDIVIEQEEGRFKLSILLMTE